jgi:DNA-binding MarR family transcriptional regulator
MLNNFCDVTLRELSRNEIAVWLNLFRDTRDGIACSSQMELARRCGVSDRTVRRKIKSLEHKGLLQIPYRGLQGKGMSKFRNKETS